MHRSGTSLVARVINLMGVDLGPPEDFLEPRFDNPRGYWEQRPLFEINERILELLGGTSADPPAMPGGWTRRDEIEELARRAREVIEAQFGEARKWGWKDPRTSLTLPFWRQVVPQAKWILCLRSPTSVAASLVQRDPNSYTWEGAISLWLRYTATALSQTRHDERLLVFYEDWFTEPDLQVARLAEFIGEATDLPSSTRSRVTEFIESGLRHHRSSAAELADNGGLSVEVRALYLTLRAAHVLSLVASTNRADLADALEPDLSRALQQFVPSIPRSGHARDQALRGQAQLEQAVETAEKERDRATVEAIARREKELAALAQSQNQAFEEAARLHEKAVTTIEKAHRESLAAVRADRDRARQAEKSLRQELSRRNKDLAREGSARKSIERSVSWRVTWPLRAAKRLAASREARTGDGGTLPRPGSEDSAANDGRSEEDRGGPSSSPAGTTASPSSGDRRGEGQPGGGRQQLQGLADYLSQALPESTAGRRIRICVVDNVLQTGGAEWFAAQLATNANPHLFEFIFITFDSRQSALAEWLLERGFRVVGSSAWRASWSYSHWVQEGLFDVLEEARPDVVFFPSHYLYLKLPADRLSPFTVVPRISNFHPDKGATDDFASAEKVICCSDEQFEAFSAEYPDKAVLIRTGIDLKRFSRPEAPEKTHLKRELGLEGKTVVLFVGRLGSPLKRVDLFERVVKATKAAREDVAFLVVGYFSDHDPGDRASFRRFVEEEGIVWKEGVPPWEVPALFKTADILLSTSAAHEGLSNTVLQALASGLVPVVTASSGMRDLVTPGQTGFVADVGDADGIARELAKALDLDAQSVARRGANGRTRVGEEFDFVECARAYQRTFLETYRERPARVCVTDGTFSVGGAEWLVALLTSHVDPSDVRFELVVRRAGGTLVRRLEAEGVSVHEAPEGMGYDAWLAEGLERAFQSRRPDIVMPCTITTWPRHTPFYRLLIIAQNIANAGKLTRSHYEQADFFICVSEEVKEVFDSAYHDKMIVLRNSVDIGAFHSDPSLRASARTELGLATGARVVLWSGRMHEPHKRLDVLKDVIDALGDDPSVHFLVVGYFRADEGDRATWERFAASAANVSWVSDAAPWDMPKYYAAADLYLSTSGFGRSDFEGLSMTSVQALAAGLPIVTTASGGQQEVVEDGVNGHLVEPGDVPGLVAGMRKLLGSDEVRFAEIRRVNQAKARARFDVRDHARIYGRLVKLLKANVGPALAADPELPTREFVFRDVDRTSGFDQRRAASFLTYTWPLLPDVGIGLLATDEDHLGPLEMLERLVGAEAEILVAGSGSTDSSGPRGGVMNTSMGQAGLVQSGAAVETVTISSLEGSESSNGSERRTLTHGPSDHAPRSPYAGAVVDPTLERDEVASHLAYVPPLLAPGAWLLLRGVAGSGGNGEPQQYSAGTICALLDHLESAVGEWAGVARAGSHLGLRKL